MSRAGAPEATEGAASGGSDLIPETDRELICLQHPGRARIGRQGKVDGWAGWRTTTDCTGSSRSRVGEGSRGLWAGSTIQYISYPGVQVQDKVGGPTVLAKGRSRWIGGRVEMASEGVLTSVQSGHVLDSILFRSVQSSAVIAPRSCS